MLQRIADFLRRMFQGVLPISVSHTKQVHSVWMQDMKPLQAITPVEQDLKETGPVRAIPLLAQERVTEPCRAIGRWRRPAERYRELDAMLAEIKEDRLLNTETTLLPVPARQLANRLYRGLEQEAGN